MLIQSGAFRGGCPVCGAAGCACGGPSDVTPVDERMVSAVSRGTMVRVAIGRGVSVQMREEEAIRRGLLPAREDKKAEPPKDKKRRPPK